MNNIDITLKKLEDLSNLEFLNDENESLKNEIINLASEREEIDKIKSKICKKYTDVIEKINSHTNIQIISKNKNEQHIEELLGELINDHKIQGNLKKIESLEQKLINNLDEKAYSELIKLKSQINRD